MSSAIVVIDPERAIADAKKRSDIVRVLARDVLRTGVDFGVVPGTKKPTLFKPGAERLCSAMGFNPRFELVSKVERWEDPPLFHYQYCCHLIHIESGQEVATGIGSCNSMESKYRWRWVPEAEAKRLGHDVDTLQRNDWKKVRMPNDDVFSVVNTVDKMAQKRALIAAVLIGANASEFFTQDVEDMPGFGYGDVVEGEVEEVETPPATPKTSARETLGKGGAQSIAEDLRDKDVATRFIQRWRSQSLSDADVLKALGVTKLSEWAKGRRAADEAVNDWIADRLEASKKPAEPADDYVLYHAHTLKLFKRSDTNYQYLLVASDGTNIVQYGGDAFREAGFTDDDIRRWKDLGIENFTPPLEVEAKFLPKTEDRAERWDVRVIRRATALQPA